jgi:DNA invertase Pin-like site-specific DNA recombinase
VPRKPRPTDRTLIGYARVSTIEQNLEMQKNALLNAGVHLDALHVEKVSGAAAHRPVLEWALDELRPGDTFVVWKLDRIARSLTDLLNKMERLKQSGASFRSLTEDIDTNTPGGRLLFHVMGAIAEFERDLIRERTRAGVRAAMERGVKFGPKRLLTPKQIKEAQAMRKRGLSLRAIGKHFGVSHTTIEDHTAGLRGGVSTLKSRLDGKDKK